MVNVNYIIAILFSFFLFDANYYKPRVYGESLYLFSFLGILLPTLFIILSKSITETGIIKTDIAQRFSLIIPILVSVIIWNQPLAFNKIFGLIIGFIALGFLLFKKETAVNKSYLYPLLVLLGYGIVDVLFKKVALINQILYTDSLLLIFTFAFLTSSLIGVYLFFKKKIKYSLSSVYWGIGLGVLNFVNIFCYIKAHKILKDNPAVVFSTMNFGVILVSTLLGYFYFKENINKYNTIGILLSLIAIALITIF